MKVTQVELRKKLVNELEDTLKFIKAEMEMVSFDMDTNTNLPKLNNYFGGVAFALQLITGDTYTWNRNNLGYFLIVIDGETKEEKTLVTYHI